MGFDGGLQSISLVGSHLELIVPRLSSVLFLPSAKHSNRSSEDYDDRSRLSTPRVRSQSRRRSSAIRADSLMTLCPFKVFPLTDSALRFRRASSHGLLI